MNNTPNFSQTPKPSNQRITRKCFSLRIRQKFVTMVGTERDLPICAPCRLPHLFLIQQDTAQGWNVRVPAQMFSLFKRTIRVFANISEMGKVDPA